MLAFFTVAIFLSASLLFLVQPMAAKMILPLLGGSPGVWNAVMLFFQSMLLAGYAYAHWLSARAIRTQVVVHAALLAVAGAMLPVALPSAEWATNAGEGSPALFALVLLGVAVGGPAFVLCSASPLISRWFALSDPGRARRLGFLYAASNAGSMIALLAYPFAVEPNLTLSAQRTIWSAAFAGLGVMLLTCGLVAWRRGGRAQEPPPPRPTAPAVAPGATDGRALTLQRLRWIVLALVPASLSMAVTQYITMDIASAPFLWVLPLSIYLLTYIIAFGPGGARFGRIAGMLLAPAAAGVAAMLMVDARSPLALIVPAHLALLFFAGVSCHARLATELPRAERLTEYYLLIAFGGVLAGLVNTLWAPNLFSGIAEYPIAIVAACLLGRGTSAVSAGRSKRRLIWEVLCWAPVALVVPAFFLFEVGWLGVGVFGRDARFVLLWAVPTALALAVILFRVRFAAALACMLIVPLVYEPRGKETLLTVRTFFGVHRVLRTHSAGKVFHELYHGRTLHGLECVSPGERGKPNSYYTPDGPYGQVIAMMQGRAGFERMGVLGLGAGGLAAYGREGTTITFFEIDPEVIAIARSRELFSFVSDSDATVEIVAGDARLTLARRPTGSFDLLCLDAFSSDSIPTHLMTKEALSIYLAALRDDGVIAWHISNLFLDLEPVVAQLAADAGLVGLIRNDVISREQESEGRASSDLVVVARTREALGPLMYDKDWRPLGTGGGAASARVWTDDYCDILSALRWNERE